MKTITATSGAHEFIAHWVLTYGPSPSPLSYKQNQINAKFFQDFGLLLSAGERFHNNTRPAVQFTDKKLASYESGRAPPLL